MNANAALSNVSSADSRYTPPPPFSSRFFPLLPLLRPLRLERVDDEARRRRRGTRGELLRGISRHGRIGVPVSSLGSIFIVTRGVSTALGRRRASHRAFVFGGRVRASRLVRVGFDRGGERRRDAGRSTTAAKTRSGGGESSRVSTLVHRSRARSRAPWRCSGMDGGRRRRRAFLAGGARARPLRRRRRRLFSGSVPPVVLPPTSPPCPRRPPQTRRPGTPRAPPPRRRHRRNGGAIGLFAPTAAPISITQTLRVEETLLLLQLLRHLFQSLDGRVHGHDAHGSSAFMSAARDACGVSAGSASRFFASGGGGPMGTGGTKPGGNGGAS